MEVAEDLNIIKVSYQALGSVEVSLVMDNQEQELHPKTVVCHCRVEEIAMRLREFWFQTFRLLQEALELGVLLEANPPLI